MSPSDPTDVKSLFDAYCAGDISASGQLFEAVYGDLRRLAGAVFQDAGGAHTLQATALVNEAWIRLASGPTTPENRHHFFALAARAMRHVLADHAKSRSRLKRGGRNERVTLSGDALASADDGFELLEFHDALERLGKLNERVCRVTELRLFGALGPKEIADVLGISERTAKRDWQFARIWLTKELCST